MILAGRRLAPKARPVRAQVRFGGEHPGIRPVPLAHDDGDLDTAVE